MYIQTEKGTLLNLDKADRIAIVNASENYLYDDYKIIASYGKKNYILATFDRGSDARKAMDLIAGQMSDKNCQRILSMDNIRAIIRSKEGGAE